MPAPPLLFYHKLRTDVQLQALGPVCKLCSVLILVEANIWVGMQQQASPSHLGKSTAGTVDHSMHAEKLITYIPLYAKNSYFWREATSGNVVS